MTQVRTNCETVENALPDVMMSDDENLSNAISDATISLQSIPSTEYPDSGDLKLECHKS